jgi:DNA-3-methyladenine glycosylase I
VTTIVGADDKERCGWVGTDPEYVRYHDEEWGVPLHGDRALFEKMCLEGFQAGLSWITILRRRPAFRRAFHGFDIDRVADMTPADAEALMADASIIRNRAKIEATIGNARVARELIEGDAGALDSLLWSFAPAPRANRFETYADFPAITPESTAMSKELKKRGFSFVGPTTMYALMQSAGMVDDHLAACWRSA